MSPSPPHTHKAATLASILIAFGCVYLFWGSTYTAIRIGAAELPALLLSGTRSVIAGSLLLAWCRMRGLRLLWPPRTMGSLAIIGCLLLTGGNVTLVYAEKFIPSGLASLIFAATPIYVALLETALPHGESLPLRGWLGVLLGFLGMIALLGPTLRHAVETGFLSDSARLIAIAACLAGALCWAIGSLYSRHQRLPVNSFVAAAWQMILAGSLNLILATVFRQWSQAHWNFAAVGSLAYLITGGSLIGYSSYVYLLQHVPVAKVATYAYINPIIAVLLGVLILHEHLEATELAGMAAILVAVALLTSAQVRSKTGQPVPVITLEPTAPE